LRKLNFKKKSSESEEEEMKDNMGTSKIKKNRLWGYIWEKRDKEDDKTK